VVTQEDGSGLIGSLVYFILFITLMVLREGSAPGEILLNRGYNVYHKFVKGCLRLGRIDLNTLVDVE